MDKRGLQAALFTGAATGTVFGTEVPSNMRRYIYKIKTANQYAGANQLLIGRSDDEGANNTPIDYIDHATEHEMWNDPDELREDALPIYIIPAGWKLYLDAEEDSVYVYILYEDSE